MTPALTAAILATREEIRAWFLQPGILLGFDYLAGVCVYRGGGDPESRCRCSIGSCIPSDKYDEAMENRPASEVFFEFDLAESLCPDLPDEELQRYAQFLDEVQRVHDNIASEAGPEIIEERDRPAVFLDRMDALLTKEFKVALPVGS